ncbi:F390 synthetase-related protein [Novosphingobium sp.]|uniref:F390 synthetase-related protein n=1 Tax=Novosphingobium sp. TaxID=1874826 RepID=UPI001EC3050F|nr:F390 synthetase-related protein [Novosphingobium sp.]MBK6801176.1 CoF synthetase [Novosphingobium sp.]MBK9011735.1 CoF synthetase [Novosphingobium sp.]
MDARAMLLVLAAYTRARLRARHLSSRERLVRYQDRQVRRLVDYAATHFPYYRAFAHQDLAALPVIDKTILVGNFQNFNRFGIDTDAVREVLSEGRERIGEAVVGQSTGTSGNRGYYVITDAERFVWLGTLLAKALPDALWRRHRVALALPGLSDLYRSATSGSRTSLAFFDLAQGVDAWADRLVQFTPDTIVAPPKVLRLLAERGQLTARRIFSGAEVLDPLDRAVIEQATGVRVREIYMATEGLFGVGCAHGTLHLAEDVVHFEWRQDPTWQGLAEPAVTDFTRRAQAMIRYRMNDLIELSDEPCACGSIYQPVLRIAGRADDLLLIAAPSGEIRTVTPDVVRNAIIDADPSIDDYRVVQTAPAELTVHLDAGVSETVAAKVRAALAARLGAMGLVPEVIVRRGITVPFDRKLRRVMRQFRAG